MPEAAQALTAVNPSRQFAIPRRAPLGLEALAEQAELPFRLRLPHGVPTHAVAHAVLEFDGDAVHAASSHEHAAALTVAFG